MSKQKKSVKSVKSVETPRVGRPRFKLGLPAGHFTFEKLCIHNGALKDDGSEYGKGEGRCVPLTVRNNLAKMLTSGEVIKLDKLGKSRSETGLGRKPYLFARGTASVKSAKSVKAKVRKETAEIAVPVTTPTPMVETPTAETPTVEATTAETPTVETPELVTA